MNIMRIGQLELSRYGKFTDKPIALPSAKRDFHLIIGHNEAGKSTIRDAILNLLFGIETRSKYDFLHPRAELRLGATVSHAGASLSFQRVKRARSLLDADGEPLADNALVAFLGTADRTFFDQMFGLDHDRLVAGGNEILKASNDVGRILFQSAAGIASLGAVRDALETEAGTLWARRKSGERAYYIAAKDLADAESALKRAIVKTKDWTDVRTRVDAIELQLREIKSTFSALEVERRRLERIRRVAAAVRAHAESSLNLAAMGEVIVLPDNAAERFAAAESEAAIAASQQTLARQFGEEARSALAAIAIDASAIRNADAIVALSERRQQTRFHERDIGKRELEIEALWAGVQDAVRQLAWPLDDETTLQTRLPPLPVRRAIADLIKQYGALDQALTAAADAERAKRREISGNELELERQPNLAVAPDLRAALNAATRLGDLPASIRRESAKLSKAQHEFRSAQAGLGEWRIPRAALREFAQPPVEVIRSLCADYDQARSARHALSEKRSDLGSAMAAAELAIAQHQNSHHAVTSEQLTIARQSRDSAWTAIRSGMQSLADGASDYEERVRRSDGLADKRHDKAQEAAELQSRIDTLGRFRLQLDDTEKRLDETSAKITAIEAEWTARATQLGFPNMPLLAYDEWQGALTRLIAQADAADLAEAEAAQLNATLDAAIGSLRAALAAAGQHLSPEASLDVLIAAGNAIVEAAAGAKARRDELLRQIANATSALAELAEKHSDAQSKLDSWNASWNKYAASARLSENNIGAAEGALVLFDAIDEKLKSIRELRKARIETMRKDLDDFEREARAIAQSIAPSLDGHGASAVSVELSARLAKAHEVAKEAARYAADQKRFEDQIAAAEVQIKTALARIAPLMESAGSENREHLRAAIARSDTYRGVTVAISAARTALENGGDGLALAQLAEETATADIANVPVRLGEISQALDDARNQQAALAASLATANAELGKIAGQDEAARAESARQEALAAMADAIERFIKVHVAGRLLRWAIDRYRETRQGPMLARASEIFAGLTRGSFAKLVVDFESDPPTLDGLRPDGRMVGIAGLSDGTRDQLFLALRLAALEMHISQGHALPFIADDLFINYDDQRSRAGLEALAKLSESTQVIFLSHHRHLLPAVKAVFGDSANIVALDAG